jgi:hypothetical protein
LVPCVEVCLYVDRCFELLLQEEKQDKLRSQSSSINQETVAEVVDKVEVPLPVELKPVQPFLQDDQLTEIMKVFFKGFSVHIVRLWSTVLFFVKIAFVSHVYSIVGHFYTRVSILSSIYGCDCIDLLVVCQFSWQFCSC